MLYLVGVIPGPKHTTDVKGIQDELNAAHSWYRYAPTAWIICTNEQASVWSQRLRPLLIPDGNVLIARLDPDDRQGWMENEFWAWFREHAAHLQFGESKPVNAECSVYEDDD